MAGDCTSVTETYAPQYMLPIAAAISYFCYAIIFYLYYVVQVPAFMRHPTQMTIYKYCFEVVYVSQYFWLAFVPETSFWLQADDDNCIAPNYWAVLCFMCQFSLLGGELWFLVLSRDMLITVTNPFANPMRQTYKYTVVVLSGATITSVALMILGPRVYGLSSDPMIWIQDQRTGNINWVKIMLFYFWMGLIYAYSFYVLWFVYNRIQSGLELTLKARLSSIHRTMTYTFGYTLFWTIVFVLQFVDFTGVLKRGSSKETIVRSISAFVLASRGIWSVCILLAGNWYDVGKFISNRWLVRPFKSMSGVEDEKDGDSMLNPHLNVVLRKELLYYTTQGIKTAVLQHQLDRVGNARSIGTFSSIPGASLFRRSQSSSSTSNDGKGLFTFSFNELNQNPDMQEKILLRTSNLRSSQIEEEKNVEGFHVLKAHSAPSVIQQNAITVSAVPLDGRASSIAAATDARLPADAVDTLATAWKEGSFAADNRKTLSNGSLNEMENGWKQPQESNDSYGSGRMAGLEGHGSGSLRHPIESNRKSTVGKLSFAGFSGFLGRSSMDDPSAAASSNAAGNNKATVTGSGRILTATPDILNVGSEYVMNVGMQRVSFCRASEVALSNEQAEIPVGQLFPESDVEAELVKQKLANKKTEKLHSDFAFRDYLPQAFHTIRQLSNIDDMDYIDAFTETTRESFSEGRSGAFLYFSKNERFIVKTTSKHEMMKLLQILPDYVEYIKAHPLSLLTRYLSAHAIVMYDTTLYFVVMLNIFPGIELSEKYDLKGSWIDRNGNMAGLTRMQRLDLSKQNDGKQKPSIPLYKDNDLQNRINLKLEAALSLTLQIREDILFLRKCDLMDYSLLIGVRRRKFGVLDNREMTADQLLALQQLQMNENNNNNNNNNNNSSNNNSNNNNSGPQRPKATASIDSQYNSAFKSNPFQRDTDGGMHAGIVEGPGTYYFGIIDILEQWTWRKRLERWFKVWFRCSDPEGISAMPPQPYADRFWKRAVRDVFEYVEQSIDEDLDVEPNYPHLRQLTRSSDTASPLPIGTRRSMLSRNSVSSDRIKHDERTSSTSTAAKPQAEDEVGSPSTVSNVFIQQRDTDRRFSLIPMDRPSNFSTINRASVAPNSNQVRKTSVAYRDPTDVGSATISPLVSTGCLAPEEKSSTSSNALVAESKEVDSAPVASNV